MVFFHYIDFRLKINILTIMDMSKKMQNSSFPLHDEKPEAHLAKNALPTSTITVNKKNNDNTHSSYGSVFKDKIEQLERDADMQSEQVELNDFGEFVSQLIDLLKHTIIIPELQSEIDWHEDIEHQLKRNKGITGNGLLDDKVDQIAVRKGLTKEQWRRLLYVRLIAGDSLEMTKVSRSHLKKVHDMASRLLEDEERTTVFALVDTIEKHIPRSHFIAR
jgi:hypothetical protein